MNTMEGLPENLRDAVFYEPTDRGEEQRIARRLEEIRARPRSPDLRLNPALTGRG